MTVLVLTSEEDLTADMVIGRLNDRGTPVMRLDPEHFPGRVDLTARIAAGGGTAGHLATEDRRVDLADIRSVWRRRPGPPGHLASVQKEWVSLESERAFYGTLRALDLPWMNHPEAIDRSHYKIWQLQAAAQVGFLTPRTLITTDPEAARAFAAGAGPVIVKSISGRHPEDPPLTMATVEVPRDADFSGVAACPTCLQEKVDKVADVRLTVVGDTMFPCRISSPGRTLDWRFLPVEECSWEITEIPDYVRVGALEYMEAAGLVYAAFDFAIDTGGNYWFLEANANGQFGFVELATGAPISQTIADWLTSPPTAERAWRTWG
ncbi:MvdC/MvdD family ATP grasp protein [Streptomyces griseoaurantiacus]|uniref:MvdC/MvdD family ATP grasp protein n=1 Tax=Streptomyces griseoaurantiacus TaxID=68213 RepID=UPI0036885884